MVKDFDVDDVESTAIVAVRLRTPNAPLDMTAVTDPTPGAFGEKVTRAEPPLSVVELRELIDPE